MAEVPISGLLFVLDVSGLGMAELDAVPILGHVRPLLQSLNRPRPGPTSYRRAHDPGHGPQVPMLVCTARPRVEA